MQNSAMNELSMTVKSLPYFGKASPHTDQLRISWSWFFFRFTCIVTKFYFSYSVNNELKTEWCMYKRNYRLNLIFTDTDTITLTDACRFWYWYGHSKQPLFCVLIVPASLNAFLVWFSPLIISSGARLSQRKQPQRLDSLSVPVHIANT